MTAPERIVRFDGAHGFLSNFYIEADGLSLEHRYQAAKCAQPHEAAWVMASPGPAIAKKRGRKALLKENWDAVKVDVMHGLLRTKFSIEPLRSRLLATGDAHLEEGNWWGDRYWGTVDGKGQNWLGKLLMQVREELRNGQG